jgi:hypothetical protein
MTLKNPLIPALLAVGLIAGCATQPAPHRARPAPRPMPVAEAPQPPRVYFYPTQGQTPEQQDRDRFECHSWAVKQTGFDPGRQASPAERVTVVPGRAPGEATLSTAITGAILGAIVSGPRNAAGGAIVGATAGGLLGAAVDNAQADEVRRVEVERGTPRSRREAAEYRRALSACLEGRGYAVK